MYQKLYFILVFIGLFQIISQEDRSMGQPGTVYIVSASPVNLRDKPNTNGKKIGSLTKGQKVLFIEEFLYQGTEEDVIDRIQAPWVKIKTEDGKLTGWMFGGYLINNPGDTKPALGYNCFNFKSTPLSQFKGGCANKMGVGPYEGSGSCGIVFEDDKSFYIAIGLRDSVSGTWEVQGNKIIGSITETSKDILCRPFGPDSEDCEREHMSNFGKKDAITINYKVEFTPNLSKNTLVSKVNTAKDPKPKLLNKTFKSSIGNEEYKCLISK